MAVRVRWEGPFFTNQSLALVNRELAMRISGSPAVDLRISASDGEAANAWDDSAAGNLRPLLGSESERAEICVRHGWPPVFHPIRGERWVVMQPWEYGALPRLWYDPMKFAADEVWVYSTFNKRCYVEAGIPEEKIRVIPLGVPAAMLAGGAPRKASGEPFRFLFVGGTILRKGIDVLLDAYTRTFSAADDVVLTIKDFGVGTYYRNQTHEAFIREIQRRPGSPEIEYLADSLTTDQLKELYNRSDCLVHPYRGEGFGLPIAEAMACGLPVIVSDEGGAADFCTSETAILVPTKRKVMPPNLAREHDTLGRAWWMEPDVGALGERMRGIFEAPDSYAGVADRGRALIHSDFTWDRSAEVVTRQLTALDPMGSPLAENAGLQHDMRMQEGVERWGGDDRLGALRNFVQAAEHDRSADAQFNIASVLVTQGEFRTALEIYNDLANRPGPRDPELIEELDTAIAECQEAAASSAESLSDPLRIRWCAPIFNASGYASESRSFLSGLLGAGTDWQIQLAAHDRVVDNGLMRADRFDILKGLTQEVQRLPDVDFQHGPASAFTPPRARFSICRTMLETDRLPVDWVDRCNRFTQVWVPTAFNRETFVRSGVVAEKIRVVPGAIEASLHDPARYPGARIVSDCAFDFFSVFDFTPRKGWDLLLRSYFEEFSPDEDVCLVIKVVSFFGKGVTPTERIRQFIEENGYRRTPRIVVLENECSDDELRRMFAGSDAFVLASRGEGWGRPYMEAMAFGLPTIGTRWSGNTEFMNDENSYLIDIEGLEPCERTWNDMPLYRGHQWAVPSIRSVRERMREVFENRDAAARRGAQARADVLAKYDEPVVAERFREELERLVGRDAVTPLAHFI